VIREAGPNVVAVGGSLKTSSKSLTALKVAAAAAEEAGAPVKLFDVRSLQLPSTRPMRSRRRWRTPSLTPCTGQRG
jgi:multimeric flavodoxin WrbA